VTVNVVPVPGTLSTATSPPERRVSSRTRCGPNPAPPCPGRGTVQLREAIEDPREVAGRDPGSLVADADHEGVVGDLGGHVDGGAGRRVLQRVVDQVPDDLVQGHGSNVSSGRSGSAVIRIRPRDPGKAIANVLWHLRDRRRLLPGLRPAVLEPRLPELVRGRRGEVALETVEPAELRHGVLFSRQEDAELVRLIRELGVLTTQDPGGPDHHRQEEHREHQEPDPEGDFRTSFSWSISIWIVEQSW